MTPPADADKTGEGPKVFPVKLQDLAVIASMLMEAEKERDYWKARAARMEEALKVYGCHKVGCDAEGGQMCDCGFEDAMKEILSPKDGR